MDEYTCEYCGNNSGMRGVWGGCVSCGAKLVKLEPVKLNPTIDDQKWFGASGGYDSLLKFGMMTTEECREMHLNNPKTMISVADIARRAVGIS